MAWIESHTVLIRHRKTLLTAHDLGIKPVTLVGHLTVLWHAILEQQEDGNLEDWPNSMIAKMADWDGDADQFVSVLQARGWIDYRLVHDWLDYVGRFLVKKYSTGNVERLKYIWRLHGRKYGKCNEKVSDTKATKKRPKSDPQETLPNLTQPNLTLPNLTNQTKEKIDVEASPSTVVWQRYSAAYRLRYGTDPIRNGVVNSQISALIKRLGRDVAPDVVEFYLRHNDQFYVRNRHPIGLLLKNCEGLHTQWKTGQSVTSAQARKIDETQARVNVFQELINERKEATCDA